MIDSLPTLPCACANLRRAARAVTQLYDAELRPLGLRTPQYTLLQVLALRGTVTQGMLGEVLALDSTTLSRTLRPLESEDLIRCRPGEDRRERHWELTSRGRKRLEGARPAWEAAQARLRKGLATEEGMDWSLLLEELTRVVVAARGS